MLKKGSSRAFLSEAILKNQEIASAKKAPRDNNCGVFQHPVRKIFNATCSMIKNQQIKNHWWIFQSAGKTWKC
jgi:hypothetical protein